MGLHFLISKGQRVREIILHLKEDRHEYLEEKHKQEDEKDKLLRRSEYPAIYFY